MPGVDTRRWIICYAASVLWQSELPVPLEELFPPYTNAAGASKQVSRKLQRGIVDGMVANSYVSVRKIGGIDHYEFGPSGRALREIRCADGEWDDMACVFGMSEVEMKRKMYSVREAEKKAKLTVAVRCITKLLAQKSPSARSALFTPKKGDKFEERAAWTPTWQGPYLDGLAKLGLVRAVPGNPVTYEVVDREGLQRIADGKAKGPQCPVTILWPDEPCTEDHSAFEVGPASQPELPEEDAAVEEVAHKVKDVLKLVSPEKREQVMADVQERLAASHEVLPDGAVRTETMEEAVQVSQAIVDAKRAELREEAKRTPPEELAVASFDMLCRVCDMLMSHSKSHTLILDSFQKMAETVADLRSKVEDLKDNVETAEDAALTMQKKQEAAQDEFANFGNQLSQIRARLSDMEKAVHASSSDSARLNDAIRKGVAEMAQQVATVAGVKPEPISPLVHAIDMLRQEVREVREAADRRPKLPRSVLRKLDEAVGELSAVKDLALDAIPDKKSA